MGGHFMLTGNVSKCQTVSQALLCIPNVSIVEMLCYNSLICYVCFEL